MVHKNRKKTAIITNKTQRGVALITVLLVVFIVSAAATSLASLQQFTIRRSSLFQHQQQAHLYTLGAEHWATAILGRDLAQGETDHLGEDWATLPPALPVQGGLLQGRIEDLQGRFNLNNLYLEYTMTNGSTQDNEENDTTNGEENDNANEETNGENTNSQNPLTEDSACGNSPNRDMDARQCKLLERLLTVLEVDPERIGPILNSIADWLDKDSEPRFPDGAEDSEYVSRTPPYLTANRPFTSVSELRLIKGVDAETYAKVAPYLCALPAKTPINVNTLTAPLLAALGGQSISLEEAKSRLESFPGKGYKNTQTFLDTQGITGINSEFLAVKSNYFLIQVEARVGEGRATLQSILQRLTSNETRVLTRSFGTDGGNLPR